MVPQVEEKKEEVLYRADPFTFIFRELDLIHGEIREIKAELVNVNKRFDTLNDSINKRFDAQNDSISKRFDAQNDSISKRFDRLYLIVILNLIGIVAFLIKGFFFNL
jgi:phage-related minor tail protein